MSNPNGEASLALSPDSPYQLGIYGKQTDQNFLPTALPSHVGSTALHGAAFGAVGGGTLGVPLLSLLQKSQREKSKSFVQQSLDVLGNASQKLQSHWKASDIPVKDGATLSDMGARVYDRLKSTGRAFIADPVMSELKGLAKKHGLQALKTGALAGTGFAAGQMLLNFLKYQSGHALSPPNNEHVLSFRKEAFMSGYMSFSKEAAKPTLPQSQVIDSKGKNTLSRMARKEAEQDDIEKQPIEADTKEVSKLSAQEPAIKRNMDRLKRKSFSSDTASKYRLTELYHTLPAGSKKDAVYELLQSYGKLFKK